MIQFVLRLIHHCKLTYFNQTHKINVKHEKLKSCKVFPRLSYLVAVNSFTIVA
jgi:hypothetical protein